MQTIKSSYQVSQGNQVKLDGVLVYDDVVKEKRPVVLVIHDWKGRSELFEQKAAQLAELGYVGFAVDMYGEGKRGETLAEKKALMSPLIENRQHIHERLQAAIDFLKTQPFADMENFAAIGYCFGGLCALELARAGTAGLKGIVSFHGLLHADSSLPSKKITSKILALHGYEDPMVLPEQVIAFSEEMTKAQADWQVHMYGQTKHAFTNPQAHDESIGTIYNALAAKRAWQSAKNFLAELFE